MGGGGWIWGCLSLPPKTPKQEAVTHSIDLVEGFPLFIGDPQGLGRLDGAFHVAGPNFQLPDPLAADEFGQGLGVLGGRVDTPIGWGFPTPATPIGWGSTPAMPLV